MKKVILVFYLVLVFVGCGNTINKDNKQVDKIDLGWGYTRDEENLYHDNKIVEFENFDVENVDLDSLEVLDYGYLKDNKNVYFDFDYLKKIKHDKKLMRINVKNSLEFHMFNKFYFTDGVSVYYRDLENRNFIKMDKVNLKVFKIIENSYAKDNYNIFYKGELIISYYRVDGENVYYKDIKLEGVDVDSFKTFYPSMEEQFKKATDKNNCYYEGIIVEMSKCR